MDVQSGYPYWAIKNGLMTAFQPLRDDARCEVAVIGGGITAAIIADRLVGEGFDVVVVEQCEIGWGSTAASTALLQYEIDTPMTELARHYGESQAVLAYRSCAQAIHRLEELAADIGGCEFRRQESLYLASRRWHVRACARSGSCVGRMDWRSIGCRQAISRRDTGSKRQARSSVASPHVATRTG